MAKTSKQSQGKLFPLFVRASELKQRHEIETTDDWEVWLSSLSRRNEDKENDSRKQQQGIKSGRNPNMPTLSETKNPDDVQQQVPMAEPPPIPASSKASRMQQATRVTPSILSSQSVVMQLIRRSTAIKRSQITKKSQWTVPSTVSLDSQRQYGVSCFAWDSMGVLLAVATGTQIIQIYEWDVLVAADMKRRRKQWRPSFNKSARPCRIIPSWTFSIPHPVTCLCWNPYHPDQLAVAFRATSQVRIYDIAKVAEAGTSNNISGSRSTWFQELNAPPLVSRSGGVRCLSFLRGNHLLVSHADSTLVLWKISLKRNSADVRWSFQLQDQVTAIEPLAHCDLVLLGGANGTIILLNWQRCIRKAFSTSVSPTIVGRWDTYSRIQLDALPSRSWMGIQTFSVRQHNRCLRFQGKAQSATTLPTWGAITVTWATACGWIMSMRIVDPKSGLKSLCVEVLHTSPKSRLLKTDGELIETKETLYSLPYDTNPADAMGSSVCWRQVPANTRVLPHHDKRVLDTSLAVDIVHNKEKSPLVWMDTNNNLTTTIRLPNKYGSPKVLSIHPSKEWIVFCNSERIHLLHHHAGETKRA